MSNPMTNYNERLDEIIQVLAMGEQGVADDFAAGAIDDGTYQVRDDVARDQAKQAFKSLIKELVAEAKPEKRTPDYYSDSIDLYSRQCAANSWNKAIDKFEQNLLKALEEV